MPVAVRLCRISNNISIRSQGKATKEPIQKSNLLTEIAMRSRLCFREYEASLEYFTDETGSKSSAASSRITEWTGGAL
ncbi:hypothetical protein HPP92_018541 [Vanilla planifolia]|uniref:Uncharacterized protein n=1 Tax=Vanilla planifolia TaxID=51239 RepID=A0A835UPG9_VANPL|nr:hypothetical protein HPP92_018541 [Vanilla planifolia]